MTSCLFGYLRNTHQNVSVSMICCAAVLMMWYVFVIIFLYYDILIELWFILGFTNKCRGRWAIHACYGGKYYYMLLSFIILPSMRDMSGVL